MLSQINPIADIVLDNDVANITKLPQYINKEYSKYSIKNSKAISLPVLNINSGPSEYLKYFNNCWILTEILFLSLKNEASFYKKPYHLLRHPLIFYYGHVATLYVNKMLVAGLIKTPVHQEFEAIFETGVDEMSWDVNTKTNQINWPKLAEVKKYREKIYNLVTKVILENTSLFKQKITQKSPLWALLMSFEHERIHLETSSVLIRELAIEDIKYPNYFQKNSFIKKNNNLPIIEQDYPINNFTKILASKVILGKKDLTTYGWDNEYGSKNLTVPEFTINNLLISNGEFFEFVKDNGYHTDAYWSGAALDWRKYRNVSHPSFWVTDGPKGSNLFKLRTCFEVIDMQWDYPVVINYFEAKAFCKYKTLKSKYSFRLPYEAEYKALLGGNQKDFVKDPQEDNYNYNLKFSSETPVTQNKQANNIYDIHGNLWQWLEENFYPLDDFAIHDYYKDFSTPCFDDKHKMIAGASFFSTGNVASINSRYHFREHFFQHAGFRMVRTNKDSDNINDIDNVNIEFVTTNPNNGNKYIIFKNHNILQILEKDEFVKKYKVKN